jgi:integrase
VLGAKPVAAIDNAQARELVSRMRNELTNDGSNRFSIKTLTEYFKTFTKVVRSAVDNNGNQVHLRTWNLAFIGLPTVDKKKQHRPTLAVEEITQLVTNTAGRYQMGVALLAGSNVRISELLALRIEKHISDDRQTLYIRQQRKKDGSGVTDVLKTPAACRDTDLHSSLAKMLDDFIGERKSGFLIQTENGTMLSPENFFRDGLESVLKKMGRTGVRFHAFRRFREATLQKSEARQLLIDYWMGHENDEMSTRYGKQLLEDVKYRKEWAEKVGLGFDLPTSNPGLFGLRGLQNEENQVAA